MTTKPKKCAACGKPTQSHNIAIDVSDHDRVGLPTLAGVCCHTCWRGDTDGTPPIGDLYSDASAHHDDEAGDRAADRLVESVDIGLMVASTVPVEDLLA